MSEETLEQNKQIIKGIVYPKTSYHTRKNIEEALNYVPQDGDIITASYPKTGSVWLIYIVLQITSNGTYFPSLSGYNRHIVMAGVQSLDTLRKPRVYMHHFRYDLVHKNPKSKYIYIYRRPEDTLVSYYHYFTDQYGQQWENFDTFFNSFLSGDVFYGSYFEHVMSYLEHKEDENLLMISYEELKAKPKDGILRIAKFLGEDYHQNLVKDESVLEIILEKTSFQYMKEHLPFNFPKNWDPKNTADDEKQNTKFFRKGMMGDGRECLSDHQLKKLHEVVENRMMGTELFDE